MLIIFNFPTNVRINCSISKNLQHGISAIWINRFFVFLKYQYLNIYAHIHIHIQGRRQHVTRCPPPPHPIKSATENCEELQWERCLKDFLSPSEETPFKKKKKSDKCINHFIQLSLELLNTGTVHSVTICDCFPITTYLKVTTSIKEAGKLLNSRLILNMIFTTLIWAMSRRNAWRIMPGVTHYRILLPYTPKCRFIGNKERDFRLPITNKVAFWLVREQYTGMCDPKHYTLCQRSKWQHIKVPYPVTTVLHIWEKK